MSYLSFERELRHLEYVMALPDRIERLPPSYWKERLQHLDIPRDMTPEYRRRVVRLRGVIDAAEQSSLVAG